jgi:hypothetical protein
MKRVITDKGVVYYHIVESSTYDYLIIFRKRTKEIPSKLFGLIPSKKVDIYHVMKGETTRYDSDINLFDNIELEGYVDRSAGIRFSCFWLDHGKTIDERIEEIKSKIRKALRMENNSNPDWDGIMIEDKAKLRELLIDDLMDK